MINESILKLYYSETNASGKPVLKGLNILNLNPTAADGDVLSLGQLIGNVQNKTLDSVIRVNEVKLS